MVIDSLEVYDTAWASISFGCDYHPTVPGDRVIQGNTFNNSQPLIRVKPASDSISPVNRYRTGIVDGDRFSAGINKETHGWHASHSGQGLSFTTIKS